MSIQSRNFPYPIIRIQNRDYINSEYISEINLIDRVTHILIETKNIIKNPELEKLLEEGRIKFVHRVECPKTYYRKIIETTEQNMKWTIPNDELFDEVSIDTLIVANENIDEFDNPDFHEDFKGITFNIKSGNILGIGKSIIFRSDKNLNSLYSVDSIFSVVRRDIDKEDGLRVDIDSGGKIQISLYKEDYNIYAHLADDLKYQSILNTMIILPALIWVFENIRLSDEFYNSNIESRWLKSINIVLEGSNIKLNPESVDKHTSFGLAQTLLGMPLERSLGAMGTGDDIE